jgi:hypothetical protein
MMKVSIGEIKAGNCEKNTVESECPRGGGSKVKRA